MNDRFQELKVFVRAAESGSFSVTARELGLSQPSVSRIVTDLEARLGTRLLLRSTRRIVATDTGAAFLVHARQILGDLDDADAAARGNDSLTGLLRIAASSAFSVRVVIPRLETFLAAHPALKIELLQSDSRHDLVAEGADMALRFGSLQDSSFGARKLATFPRVLVASPAYIAARGWPKSVDDLASHDCIAGPGGSAQPRWQFTRDGSDCSVKIEPRIKVGSAEALMAAVRVGLGISFASALACQDEIAAGHMVTLLDDYQLEPVDLHAVFPAGRVPSQKARRFTDFLLDEFARG